MTRAPAIRARIGLAVLAALLAAVVLGFVSSSSPGPGPSPGPSSSSGSSSGSSLVSSSAPSCWASKRNPLNTYGAKLAWAWTTALFVTTLPVTARPARSVVRYALATLYWLAMTRWFFGPPLFDRLFVHTGGACQLHSASAEVAPSSLTACRAAGGAWAGGHDVSGHCFLLLHSGLFLAEEVLVPLLPRIRAARLWVWALAAATLGLISVWILMLFCTAKYFHGLDELLSGSLLGLAYWFATYNMRVGYV
ncbi:hypothetical protein GGI20_004370 [Coemansia sp. BCRC 34301]|nr:hypothetical protein GGI20_004370 [Coemansia sp. BCRC 34301]